MDSPTTEPYISDIQWMGGAAGKGGGGQVKTGQNSDESRSLQGEGEEIHINWMAKAIISISAIRVQTVFQTGVWFCFRQHFGFIFSIPTVTCLLGFYCRILSLI